MAAVGIDMALIVLLHKELNNNQSLYLCIGKEKAVKHKTGEQLHFPQSGRRTDFILTNRIASCILSSAECFPLLKITCPGTGKIYSEVVIFLIFQTDSNATRK